jgi:molybdopterin converting factor small subunit
VAADRVAPARRLGGRRRRRRGLTEGPLLATVHLPRSLVSLFGGDLPRRAEIEGATVDELIDELDRRWPGMRDRLCEAGPRIREHINVFVDGDRAELSTALAPGAVVHVIPAVSGGATAGSAA